MVIIEDTGLNLEQTFECGQCFRWNKTDAQNGSLDKTSVSPDVIAYKGIAMGKELTIVQQGNKITLHCTETDFENIWKNYLDLDCPYQEIREELSNMSPVLAEAALYAPGIHILRQDPWEAICSFIISQNNNIPRIKGIIERLCSMFGEKIGDNAYAFPSAEKISRLTIEDLAPIRSGFRAKYILSAAKGIASGEIDLDLVAASSIEEGRLELMKIHGVGPKVAECALLYGFHKTEGFPVDVWMKRAVEVLIPDIDIKDFGKNAGIAQQYLFHYSRMHPELF